MDATLERVLEKLREMRDPCLNLPLSKYPFDVHCRRDGDNLHVEISWPYPAAALFDRLKAAIRATLSDCAKPENIFVQNNLDVPVASIALPGSPLENIRNLVAVASGKGGVGKSVTAVNLALALQAQGARVGLLDADIYGPSARQMLGLPEDLQLEVEREKWFKPVEAKGLVSMSISYLVGKKTPMVWRGPMASGALQQMLNQTLWGKLDYLIVDMPPGTGDIQLTLSQKANVAGAVIVTTPQDVALLDARKAIEMFTKVKIPVLGMIENMSTYVCPHCGHESGLFGEGDATARMADEYGVALLGRLPLDVAIRTGTDTGASPVLTEPNGRLASIYRTIAHAATAHLALKTAEQRRLPPIKARQL